MNGEKLVSIIIPNFNNEDFLDQCLKSIINQSYTNFEIIIIDDGSSDNSLRIIKEYQDLDTRVNCIFLDHGGVSRARNTGIMSAKGYYLTFIDADDWVSKDFLKEAITYIETYKLDFVLGATAKIYSNRQEICSISQDKDIYIYQNNLNFLKSKVLSGSNGCFDELNNCFTSGPVCKLFKKEILKNIKFDELIRIGEDTLFNLAVLENAQKVGVVSNVWYLYRMNNHSATKKINPNIDLHISTFINRLIPIYMNDYHYIPFLTVRAIQEFYTMLNLYPFHPDSNMHLYEKISYIKKQLNTEPWNCLFSSLQTNQLPCRFQNKVLGYLLQHKYSVLIIIYIQIRNKLKYLKPLLRENVNEIKNKQ